MKKLIAALLVLLIFSIGLDVFVRLNKPERPLQVNENRSLRIPIRTMLARMQHGLISEDDAKAVSLEIWNEIWGDLEEKEDEKVVTCEWDEHSKHWKVLVMPAITNRPTTTAGTGCEVTISDLGYIDKIQYSTGL